MIEKGMKVWVFHYGQLKQYEVLDVVEFPDRKAYSYLPSFMTYDAFLTKEEAYEFMLKILAKEVLYIKEKNKDRYVPGLDRSVEIAKYVLEKPE